MCHFHIKITFINVASLSFIQFLLLIYIDLALETTLFLNFHFFLRFYLKNTALK